MATRGRKSEEKTWDTTLKHTLQVNVREDPRLHTFMFICGENLGEVMKAALTDYMRKIGSKALDDEFCKQVAATAFPRLLEADKSRKTNDILMSMGLDFPFKLEEFPGAVGDTQVGKASSLNVARPVPPQVVQEAKAHALKASAPETLAGTVTQVNQPPNDMVQTATEGTGVKSEPEPSSPTPVSKSSWLNRHNY